MLKFKRESIAYLIMVGLLFFALFGVKELAQHPLETVNCLSQTKQHPSPRSGNGGSRLFEPMSSNHRS